MLSNPSAESSAGSRVVASTSMFRSSRMAFAYSARFNRWRPVAPGFGVRAATRSSRVSSVEANSSMAAREGLAVLAGGIIPVRSLRTTFSHVSALGPTSAGSRDLRSSCPAFRVALWQVEQDWFRKARVESGGALGPPGVCAFPIIKVKQRSARIENIRT